MLPSVQLLGLLLFKIGGSDLKPLSIKKLFLYFPFTKQNTLFRAQCHVYVLEYILTDETLPYI